MYLFNMKKKMLLKKWRKEGIYLLLLTGVFGFLLSIPLIPGFSILLATTVPCGIDSINKNRYLWTLRQTYFVFLALIIFIGDYYQVSFSTIYKN